MRIKLRTQFMLGLSAALVIGCAKDNAATAKNDPPPSSPPVNSTTTGDIPASGQVPTTAPTPATAPAAPPTNTAATATKTPTAAPSTPGTPVAGTKPTPPAVKPSDGMYAFKYAPTPGTVDYNVTTSIDFGQGQPIPISEKMSDKVTKNPDGTFTVESTTSGGPSMGGASKPMTSTTVVDSKGKVLSTKASGGGAKMDPFGGGSVSSALPDHPVKVGDTWTTNGGGRNSGPGMVCKLIKVDNKSGKPLATIQIVDLKIPPQSGMKLKLAKPGSILIEVNTGIVHTMTFDAETSFAGTGNLNGGGSGMKMPGKMKLQFKMEKQ